MIGMDSFHTIVLFKNFQKRKDVEIAWIDTTQRSSISFAHKRQEDLISNFQHPDLLQKINLRENHNVDAYCLLNVDSKSHFETLMSLPQDKPIFIDKPIFDNLKYFDEIDSYQIMSSSGLRFSKNFINIKYEDNILIEGPLEFIEGIKGYFWYGIHLVEMVHTLSDAPLNILNIHSTKEYDLINGESNGISFTIKGHKKEYVNYSITNSEGKYELFDLNEMYKDLSAAVIRFFEKPSDTLDKTYAVMNAIEQIHNILEL